MSAANAGLVARMLQSQHLWLIRRKLSVSLIDSYWHRRQLTIDYQYLPAFSAYLAARKMTTVPVPVSLLEKSPGQTSSYDLTDETGCRLNLSTLDDRLATGCDALSAMASLAITAPNQPAAACLLAPVFSAVTQRDPSESDRKNAVVALWSLRDNQDIWVSEDSRLGFTWLALSLIDRSLLTIDRPVARSPGLIKLAFLASHERDRVSVPRVTRAGLKAWPFALELSAWQAQSVHVDIEAPPGLEILRSQLVGAVRSDPDNKGKRAEVCAYETGSAATPSLPIASAGIIDPYVQAPRGTRTHLYLHLPPLAFQSRLSVDFRVARSGFVSAAAWITAVIALVFLVVTVGLHAIRQHADAGGALLLALPALGGAVVTQSSAHSVTNMMLTTVRRAVYAASLLALAGCAFLLVDSHDHGGRHGHHLWPDVLAFLKDRWPWLALFLATTWLALLTYLARRLPAETPEVKRTHRLLEIITWPLVQILSWPRIY